MANPLQSTIDWLIDGARSAPRVDQFIAETCERFVAAGIPLWRVGVFVRTLHPSMLGRNFIWKDGEGVTMGTLAFGEDTGDDFLLSPLHVVFFQSQEVRQRLTQKGGTNVPFYADMIAAGATDYIAYPMRMSDGPSFGCSFVTRAPGGFTDQQIAAMRSAMPALTRMAEIHLLRRTAAGLLDNYVGQRAGARILAGQIRRGHTETMDAVIWLSDLRGFTKLSDRLSSESVVQILNAYFDCQVPSILGAGGEVLKFMGDGLLAVFPIAEDGSDAADVCARVVKAAQDSAAHVGALRFDTGTETIDGFRFGVALHVGRVLYGNIGGGDRLDFTCIGPAVNLAARLEKIAGQHGRTIVASSLFTRHYARDFEDLGEFDVAGFSASERVYALAENTPLAASPEALS